MLSTDVAISFAFLELGTVVYALLLLLLIQRRPRGAVDWGLAACAAAALAWYGGRATDSFYTAFGTKTLNPGPPEFLLNAGLFILPPAMLQVAAGLNGRRHTGWFYFLAAGAWWLLNGGYTRAFLAMLAVCALAASAELLGRKVYDDAERLFRQGFSLALGVMVAGAAAGRESNWAAVGGLAPAVCLLYFISRYQFPRQLITRRLVFATIFGLASAFYLLLIRRVADAIEARTETFTPAIELLLILAAVLAWVPLYAWMNRTILKRTRLFLEFGEQLTQKAAAILEFEARLGYVARELGRLFRLRRVLIGTADEATPRIASFGPPAEAPIPGIAAWVREERIFEVLGPRSEGRAAVAELLDDTPFNYLFPLWYEDRLVGLLLLDSSPRQHLDEDLDMLEGLSRQIAHAIESGRLVERKISLETALARSEHMAALGQLAASVVHEVKNPLSSIKAISQIMREDPGIDPEHVRDLSFIEGEINRLNSRVEQLLTFSRPIPEDRREVCVGELLENISRNLNREHTERGIRVTHAAGEVKLRKTNPYRLHEIVLNLAINAVQASPPESTVELLGGFSSEGGGRVIIRVADHGSGIPREIQGKIFDPFFTTKPNGSGLGLATVYWHVRHLGGEIRFESPAAGGGGTVFTVTLPMEAA